MSCCVNVRQQNREVPWRHLSTKKSLRRDSHYFLPMPHVSQFSLSQGIRWVFLGLSMVIMNCTRFSCHGIFLRHFTCGDSHWIPDGKGFQALPAVKHVCFQKKRIYIFKDMLVLKAHIWIINCQAHMRTPVQHGPYRITSHPLIMYCLVPVWMTFQKLTELLQFNWCWHLLKPCLEALRVIVCFFCFSPMPLLGYLTACGAWLAPALFIHVQTCSGSGYKSPC